MSRRERALGSRCLPALAIAALSALGCTADPVEIAITLTAGQETDAFTREPAVSRVDVVATSVDGEVVVSASAAPGGSFDLGEIPSDARMGIEATGFDASGNVVLRGRSIAAVLGDVTGGALPVFVQRTDAWARPSGGLAATHLHAPAATFSERYVFLSGGDPSPAVSEPRSADFYDLLALSPAVSDALPRVARSLVTLGSAALVIGDGGATWIDFDAGTQEEAALPTGLASFDEVASGRTIQGPNDEAFVVGATRAGAPTRSILGVSGDGTLRVYLGAAARSGAAAAWLDGVGLVIAGGSAEGAGVEVLGEGATALTALPFEADPTEGAAAFPSASDQLTLVGGVAAGAAAKTRTLDLACSAACASVAIEPSLPASVRGAVAYVMPDGRAVVIGEADDQAAETLAFLLDAAAKTATELVLREPRSGATPVATPNGTLMLVGGVHLDGSAALSVESWFPM